MNSFLRIARPIVTDALGVILFAILLAMHANLIAATAVGASIAVGVVLWHLLKRRPVGELQWMSLALVTIAGGATLLTNDPRFVMAKPSVIYAVLGAVMLRRGWMHRYVPAAIVRAEPRVLDGFGYAWAGLMFLTSVANLVVAVVFTPWWPAFIAAIPLASKIVLFSVQFVVMRTLLRGRLKELPTEAVGA